MTLPQLYYHRLFIPFLTYLEHDRIHGEGSRSRLRAVTHPLAAYTPRVSPSHRPTQLSSAIYFQQARIALKRATPHLVIHLNTNLAQTPRITRSSCVYLLRLMLSLMPVDVERIRTEYAQKFNPEPSTDAHERPFRDRTTVATTDDIRYFGYHKLTCQYPGHLQKYKQSDPRTSMTYCRCMCAVRLWCIGTRW
ncbi:hypothetical protein BDY19DRAFT_756193 [Irpex rosettiformis]|uniref:Uncharacterized protein n=1 Tax=Irpex rosettiformis TaxID=378272 RepID=A0ACB8U7B8_9APHY|nr:hypothetical protein BDY19DRAFT_756193 [Irpex rosettiformis]